MRFPAKADLLPQMLDFIREKLAVAKFDIKEVHHVELAAEEALINVIQYAYPAKEGEIEIDCNVLGDKLIEIEIRDWGKAFDPSSALENIDTTSSLEEREIGGLGVYFIYQLMDEVTYKRDGEMNILKLVKGKD